MLKAELQKFVSTDASSTPVIPSLSADNQDSALCKRIDSLTEYNPDLWSSPDRTRNDSTHCFFQYPAMMVPKVQRHLAEAILATQEDIQTVIDPFLGSGTALVSTMHRGLNCYGQDINPLAILLARTRTGPDYALDIFDRFNQVLKAANADKSVKVDITFPGIDKWFLKEVAIDLSKLRRAIQREENLWARRFLWVVLAETVRLTSNDRTSTYKLHARSANQISSRTVNSFSTFSEIGNRNISDLNKFLSSTSEAGWLKNGSYLKEVNISLGDSMQQIVAPNQEISRQYDLLVTSPPYGDNTSTVPYGQHSYLPLQWIDMKDIDSEVDASCLRTTQEIDRRALGGKKITRSKFDFEVQELGQESDSLGRTFFALKTKPIDRIERVASFYKDFSKALDHIVSSIGKDRYMVWTVGNRTVGGVIIPNNLILQELLYNRGVKKVKELERTIHFKRMPDRNEIAQTMSKEDIIIFRKT